MTLFRFTDVKARPMGPCLWARLLSRPRVWPPGSAAKAAYCVPERGGAETYARDLVVLGDLLGDIPRANELNGMIAEAVGLVTSRAQTISSSERPRVLFIYADGQSGSLVFNIPPAGWM